MARLIGPDEGSRLVYITTGTDRGKALASGYPVLVYSDSAATTLASIQTLAGATISGSALTVDDYSQIPLFKFPDGVDTVYVKVNGGPATAVYARNDDRFDDLRAATAQRAGRTALVEILGRRAESAPGVTFGSLGLASATPAWVVNVGTGTWNAAANTVTTSLVHGFAVGDPVRFSDHGTISNGVNEALTYFILTTPTSTSFTMSQTLGGSTQDITADGTPCASVFRNPSIRENAWTSGALNTAMRVTNGKPVVFAATMIQSDPATLTYAPGSQTGPLLAMEVMWEDTLDILLRNNGAGGDINIYIDGYLGRSVTAAEMTALGIVGTLGRLPLTSTVTGKRHVRIEQLGAGYFAGFDRKYLYPISYPTIGPKGAKTMIHGDSFTEGVGGSGGLGYVQWLQWMTGWGDVWRCGSGSTGYLEDGTRTSLSDRYTTDVIAHAPDRVIIALGLNDRTQYLANPAAVTTAALAVWDAILAGLPNAQLIIVGPWLPKGVAAFPEMVTFDTTLRAAADTRGLFYISPVAEGWITGTGRVGATVGDGNADVYTSSDGTHPSAAGHQYLAWRLAGHLLTAA